MAVMFSKVLVMCVGNICRSPMAVALLRHRLPSGSLQVSSAGLQACVGAGMDPSAKAVLADYQIASPSHHARQFTHDMLHWAELILLMEQRQVQTLVQLAPEVRGKVFLIGKWRNELEIADPYRRPKTAFQQTYSHLSRCIDDWLPYLRSEDRKK